jgi:hypothetical protein
LREACVKSSFHFACPMGHVIFKYEIIRATFQNNSRDQFEQSHWSQCFSSHLDKAYGAYYNTWVLNSSKELKGPNSNNLIAKIRLFSNLCISLSHKPCIYHNTLATLTQIIIILELLKKKINFFFDEICFEGKWKIF